MRRRLIVWLIVALLFAIFALLFKSIERDDFDIENKENISQGNKENSENNLIINEDNQNKEDVNNEIEDEIIEDEIYDKNEDKDDENTHSSPADLNIIKKIWHIVEVNKNQIVFDEISILPDSECEGMEMCFVNNSKIFNKFSISKDVEIDSYFVNYLTNWNLKQSKKIWLNCFIEFFESDDYTNYTWFDKIPYWISLQNWEVTKIEEQQIKSQYMLNDDFYENKDL